jgi:hypothetical protein
MFQKFFVFVIILFFLGLLFFIFFKNDEKITAINDIFIYRKELSLFSEVQKNCYQNEKISEEEALAMLINNKLELVVLKKKYNLEPDLSVLTEKAKWIDKNTRAPAILKCTKNTYFPFYKRYYLEDIVKPTLINPKLHFLFSKDREIHKEEIAKIEKIMKQVKNNPEILKSFQEYTKATTSKINKEKIEIGGYSFDVPEDPFVSKVLAKLKKGKIFPDIVEDDYFFKIVRLIDEDKENYYWDGIIIMKKSFDDWFKNYVKENVKVKILDEGLKEKFKKRFPNIWLSLE